MSYSGLCRPCEREFRVLDILPGNWEEKLECNLKIVKLNDMPEYEALSYVWGEPVDMRVVTMSGHDVEVTPNLYAALRRLRHSKSKRTVWADALCINQWDVAEKANQVAMMREIYTNCKQCIIWLGEMPKIDHDYDVEDAEAVFDFIRCAATAETHPLHELPVLFRETLDGEKARQAFRAFAMYGNPWWTRIWTVQEAIIPKSAVLLWGSLSVSRNEVKSAARMMRSDVMHLYFSEEFTQKRIQRYELLRHMLYPIRGFMHSEDADGPLDLLMRWRHRAATDPRDKVYALLGLMPVNSLPSAQYCDYSVSICSLFSNTTADLIRLEQGLRPLLGSSELPHKTSGLPTWAIDFACSNRVSKRQLKWWNHSHRYREFTACADRNLQILSSEDAEVLRLVGTLIDEVADVFTAFALGADDVMDNLKLYDTVEKCEQLVQRNRNSRNYGLEYVTGGTWESAFWRSMIGDLLMKEVPVERAGPQHAMMFSVLIDRLKVGKSGGPLYESLCGMVSNHSFFMTKKGYMGVGPPQIAPGDQVWIFDGGNVPFAMRRTKDNDVAVDLHSLTLVGDVYVHGIMDGQGVLDDNKFVTAELQ